jgi:hypothetical protein
MLIAGAKLAEWKLLPFSVVTTAIKKSVRNGLLATALAHYARASSPNSMA